MAQLVFEVVGARRSLGRWPETLTTIGFTF